MSAPPPAGTDLNAYYRAPLHLRHPDVPFFASAAEIPSDAERAQVIRKKRSLRGLAKSASLRELEAAGVDQAALEEICALPDLEYLDLSYPFIAEDLLPIAQLTKLRHLKIDTPRKIRDFGPILDLPALDHLFLSSIKGMSDFAWLAPLKGRLVALGVEGGIYDKQSIDTLSPLAGANLEALFLTSTVIEDQDLSPIAKMPRIRFLGTGITAPRAQFFALRDAKPELECAWFDPAAWQSFRDPRPPKLR